MRSMRPRTQKSAPATGGMLMYSGGPSRSRYLPLAEEPRCLWKISETSLMSEAYAMSRSACRR